MASGKKNYFRHSFFARNDMKMKLLRDRVGIGFYFYFFSLLEQCGEASSDNLKDIYEFHDSTIRSLWGVNLKKSERIANEMMSVGLLEFKKLKNSFQFAIPNFAKYMGKYETKNDSNSPNKRKEKERKEKEIKEVSPPLEILDENKESEKPVKNIVAGFFAEPEPQELEEIPANETAIKILTALNSICFKNFRPVKSNLQFINARLKEKYTYEDFVEVIKHRNKKWGHDPKMNEYLRPKTLFNSENFDGYVQEAKNANKPLIDPLDEFFAPYVAKFNQAAL